MLELETASFILIIFLFSREAVNFQIWQYHISINFLTPGAALALAGAAAFFFPNFPMEKVMVGAVYAEAEAMRRAETVAANFILTKFS